MESLKNLLDSPELAKTSWSIKIQADTGEVLFSHDEQKLLSTASVAKLFLLIEASSMMNEGSLAPSENISRNKASRVGDSGLWQHLQVSELSVQDICCLIASTSDNWATNVLLNRITLEKVQKRAKDIAKHGSTLLDFVRDKRTAEHPKTLSVGCAADWVNVVNEIVKREMINSEVSEQLEYWLSLNSDLSLVMSSLNLDPLAHQASETSIITFNKTGTDIGIRADIGHIKGNLGGVTFSSICNWDANLDMKIEPAVYKFMKEVGSAIKEYLSI